MFQRLPAFSMNGAVSANEPDPPFSIPELPEGSLLRLCLLSNWGDSAHIGIQAIEVFTNTGRRAHMKQISSNGSDCVGDLSSIFVDSFSIDDSKRSWRARKEDGPIAIEIELTQREKIAMIRIWNYNESRVHAQMGVRQMDISLEGRTIFQGEIDSAHSGNEGFEHMGETVLFTTDESILESIAENDSCLIPQPAVFMGTCRESPEPEDFSVPLTPFRPPTAEVFQNVPEKGAGHGEKWAGPGERPQSTQSMTETQTTRETNGVRLLHLELLSNWGHPDSIGLCGIDIIDGNSMPLSVRGNVQVTASFPGAESLINGRNLSTSPSDMWCCPFDGKRPATVTLRFEKSLPITAISLWNYNSSSESSFAGVKSINVFCDGKLAAGCILRKAPGYVFFDFVQDVRLESPRIARSLAPPRPATHSIGGFIFQLRLLSTWGDEFYIGLNGVELFDRKENPILLKPHNLAAFPESINILPSVHSDPRVSHNLIDHCNDTKNACHMWLTPLLPNSCARVFFVFDQLTFVSRISLFNYTKTPSRGVRHFTVSVDDLIVFSGELPESRNGTAKISVDLREQ